MSTVAPSNVIAMWNIMIPIVMFDLLESIPVIQELFPQSEIEMSENTSVLDQMRDIGYDSFNTVLNLGSLFVVILLYLIRVIA